MFVFNNNKYDYLKETDYTRQNKWEYQQKLKKYGVKS